ncbi:unnamed protein product [Effrenium voratum]|uniref:ATP-dependent DNA helicase n=1 Tax=Effrenium voratum TaxID=2562239 RepID=A0AA36MY39_9DINO|nr:unnamed protein product [Effrenium voratum]
MCDLLTAKQSPEFKPVLPPPTTVQLADAVPAPAVNTALPEAVAKGNVRFNAALTQTIKKCMQQYEEMLNIEDLGKAYGEFDKCVQAGEGLCDPLTLTQLLVALTRANRLANCHKVLDAAVAEKVYLDPNMIVTIAMAVSQRSQSHKALRYLRRMVYECLPEEQYPHETVQLFDRHLSFIFSELMAEADGCFCRMENRDSNTLVNLGHTELDIQMDWQQSHSQTFSLFNRKDDKGKKVYMPTVIQSGFQRTDVALMSIDISHPDMARKVPNDYDRIRDGAEVEVINSATQPDKTAPLGVKLTSPPKVNFEEGLIYRLDRLASTDQTRRMLEALKVILKNPAVDPSPMIPHEVLRKLITNPVEKTLKQANLSHLPLEPVDYSNSKIKMDGLQAFQNEAKHVYAHLLNKSQIEALELSSTRRLTLIQGPPGTGKTTTAVQIVAAMVRYGLVDLPILVTADSNTAVDNLVKGIGKTGVNIVRVGRPEAIREDVKAYALDGRWKDLKKAEVVCATCIGASGTTLDKVKFPTVIVDECTQAAETAALVPIARGCQQAILIGDQCQLPPTVLSDVAETENLGESLFTRLVTQGVRPCLLDTQYRMHPLVAEFASAAFYNGRLQNGVSHIHRKPPEGFPWPQRHMPVAFINLEKCEEKREGHGSSYINPAEAEKTMWALLEVTKNGKIGPEDVGIVTPYKGQVRLLKKLINERPGLQKFRSGLEVESVDRFQGQEKEVIIFCAVRNNREGKVGFLCDWRRLNVMLTRARIGLIVIGSRSTLMSDPLWHEWLIWAAARGAICGESAKGSWVPRYLVDDRDGIWTVKQGIIEEVQKGINPKAGAQEVVKVEQKEEDILDSWEDMESPIMTPANGLTGSLEKALEEDPAELPETEAEEKQAVCSTKLRKTPLDSVFTKPKWLGTGQADRREVPLTPAQRAVVDLVLSGDPHGRNLFLTGPRLRWKVWYSRCRWLWAGPACLFGEFVGRRVQKILASTKSLSDWVATTCHQGVEASRITAAALVEADEARRRLELEVRRLAEQQELLLESEARHQQRLRELKARVEKAERQAAEESLTCSRDLQSLQMGLQRCESQWEEAHLKFDKLGLEVASTSSAGSIWEGQARSAQTALQGRVESLALALEELQSDRSLERRVQLLESEMARRETSWNLALENKAAKVEKDSRDFDALERRTSSALAERAEEAHVVQAEVQSLRRSLGRFEDELESLRKLRQGEQSFCQSLTLEQERLRQAMSEKLRSLEMGLQESAQQNLAERLEFVEEKVRRGVTSAEMETFLRSVKSDTAGYIHEARGLIREAAKEVKQDLQSDFLRWVESWDGGFKRELPNIEKELMGSLSTSLRKGFPSSVDFHFRWGRAQLRKSVVLRAVNRSAKRQVALTAPTGAAAVLIGGETTHSWAGIGQARRRGLFRGPEILKDAGACQRWNSAKMLVIDEVSMISAWLLDLLDACGRSARGCFSLPFGGLQVLLCGDFHQLPPPDNHSGWAFEAKVWKEAIGLSLELTEVLRTDPAERQLCEALDQARLLGHFFAVGIRIRMVGRVSRPTDRCPAAVVPTNRQAGTLPRPAD